MYDHRFQTLHLWLKTQLNFDFSITPVVGDASFRRYFRITHDNQTWIAADAPPDKEASDSFIAISHALTQLGICVPKIFAFDLTQGFLLLNDFGNQLYQTTLTHSNADTLYGAALSDLIKMQSCQKIDNWPLPQFDATFLREELDNFRYWFIEQYLQISLTPMHHDLLTRTFTQLIHIATHQPQCFIHRDYHSRNLMVLEDGVGVLDFQDAAWGPITYDAVSLLRDCYITWSSSNVKRWALSFADQLRAKGYCQATDDVFLHWFDWMGIQRHLKAIFIFARKSVRDGVDDYLRYIPNGLQYILDVTANYSELHDFGTWLAQTILPHYSALEANCV